MTRRCRRGLKAGESVVILNRDCVACLFMNNYWATNERKWKRDWTAERALQFGEYSRAKRGNISTPDSPDEPTYGGVQNRGMLTGKFFSQVHALSFYFLLSFLVTNRSDGLSLVTSRTTKFFSQYVLSVPTRGTIYIDIHIYVRIVNGIWSMYVYIVLIKIIVLCKILINS